MPSTTLLLHAAVHVRTRSVAALVGACLAITMLMAALFPRPAAASITTVGIVAETLIALPSCAKYEVKGMCFFLRPQGHS